MQPPGLQVLHRPCFPPAPRESCWAFPAQISSLLLPSSFLISVLDALLSCVEKDLPNEQVVRNPKACNSGRQGSLSFVNTFLSFTHTYIIGSRQSETYSGFEGSQPHFAGRETEAQTLNDLLKSLGSWQQSEIKPA